jgi:hypothetical protein
MSRHKLKKEILSAAKRKFSQEKSSNIGILATISPSPLVLIDLIVADLDNYLNKNILQVFIDLGCGDGRWLHCWWRNYPRDVIIGFDANMKRLLEAKSNCDEMKSSCCIDLIHCDFDQIDISIATVVVVYLSIEGNQLIKTKLENECKSGTIAISLGVSKYILIIFIMSHFLIC